MHVIRRELPVLNRLVDRRASHRRASDDRRDGIRFTATSTRRAYDDRRNTYARWKSQSVI